MSDGDQLQLLEIRIRELEKQERDRSLNEAREDERRKTTTAEFARIHERLNKIDSHVGRVVWIMLAAVIGGFMTFVIRGGMNSAGF